MPYHLTWEHEVVPAGDKPQMSYVQLRHIGEVPGYVAGLANRAGIACD
ncbi:MAG: hypothetical protein HXY39_05250 [Chloroflexi bacterium]|nr:hypothetical protein [Chloroflexota bacterium]